MFSRIIEFILAFSEIALGYMLAGDILLEKEYLNKKEKVMLFIATCFLSMILFTNRKIAFVSYIMLGFSIIFTSVVIFIIKKKDKILIIGVVSAYYLFVTLSELFLAFISMSFLNYNFKSSVYHNAISVWKYMIYLCVGIISWITYCTIRKKKRKESVKIENFKKLLIIFDVFLYLVLRQYLRVLEKMALREQEMQGILTGMSLLFIVSIVAFVSIILMKYKILQEEHKFYLIRDEIYKKNCDDMESVLQLNREMFHNIKNHLLVMKRMGEENEDKRLKEYVYDLCQEFEKVERVKWTNNQTMDIIVNQKKIMAEQKGIIFTVKSMILPKLEITDTDICVLFGNLLDNAIEACEKILDSEKYIEITIELQAEILFIRIMNSMQEKPKTRNGKLITSKKDVNMHGIGIKSAERIINKYDGIMLYNISDKVFETNITFFNVLHYLN